MARGNSALAMSNGEPVATRSASGRVGCYRMVPDPRFQGGRRAQRLCNSACGLPAKHPSSRCGVSLPAYQGGGFQRPMVGQYQPQIGGY